MTEGWQGDDYLILFDDADVVAFSQRYGLASCVPGYEIIGLRGWDDFIVRNRQGELFSIPTVPLDAKYLVPLTLKLDARHLKADDRFRGKIKWYVKPIVFSGDASSPSNVAWIAIDQHVDLVNWWNKMYQNMAKS